MVKLLFKIFTAKNTIRFIIKILILSYIDIAILCNNIKYIKQ